MQRWEKYWLEGLGVREGENKVRYREIREKC
jgi:hypothetical protein